MTDFKERDDEILPALGYLAAGMTAMLARLSREALAPFGIMPVQTAILMYCSRNQENTIERLVGAIHVDRASVSRHVATLVKRGLIQRTRPYDEDRRIVRLDLTRREGPSCPGSCSPTWFPASPETRKTLRRKLSVTFSTTRTPAGWR